MRKTFIQTIIAVLICVFLIAVGATAVTVIFPSQGGTGIGTYTTGDILYSDATNSLAKLGIGSTDEVLTVAGGVPTWAAGGGVGDVTGVGDCASGACLDGSADGGTYIRIYDGDSNYLELNPGNIGTDRIVDFRDAAGTVILSGDTFTGEVTATLDIDGSTALTIADSVAVTSWNLTTPTFTTSATVTDAFTLGLGGGKGLIQFDDEATDFISLMNAYVGIGTTVPDSIFHIKANIPGTVGSHPAGQLIIQNPTDSVFSNVVITGYESDGSGNPDQQLWYLGSSSGSNSDIILLNRRNSKLQLGTNGVAKMTILGDGNVGIGVTDPDTQLEVLYAGNQLKLSFDGTDNTIFAVDTSGDLTITPSGTQIIVSGNISATNLSGTNTGDNDEVGTLTNTKWCTTDGSVVNCATNAPVLTEVDPNVNTESEIEAITGAYFGASKAVTAGYIWVADGTDFESVIMSNDCTLASGGAITCDHDALDNFLAAEHIDWAGASAGTIHIDNYIENATHTGDVTGSGALTIAADKVLESHLKAVDEAADEECLTYESTTGDFEWQSCGGTPTVITVADTTDTTSYVALWESATGDLEPKSDAGITYNATTGMLTATGFTGPLTGNADTVTGFTPASGSLTLAGADALTITTTGATNSTLPLGTKTLVATDVATLSSLTSIGTIGTGVWEATDIGVTHGGTGVSAFTQYLLMYADTTTSFGQIAIGSAGQVLTSGGAGSAPAFETLSIAAGEYAADSIDFADIVDADQATTKCILIETPADADDLMFFRNNRAATVTSVDCICEAATSAVVVIVECDSAGDNCGTSRFTESLTCDVDGATDDGVAETGIVAGAWLRAQVGTVTGTPGHVTACITFTYDD